MKKILLIVSMFVLGVFYSAAQCDYTINASDSWGDGWNGNAVDVQLDGVSVPGSPYSLPNGNNGTFIFTVNPGQVLTLTWSIGSFNNEASYTMVDNNGSTLYAHGTNGAAGLDFSGVTSCSISCALPSGLFVSNITNISADLSWNTAGGATDYNVQWGSPGFIAGSGNEIGSMNNVAGTTTTATGLSPDSNYDYFVMTNCGGTGTEMWVGPFSFTTLPLCPVPTGVTAVTGAFDAALSWNQGGTEVLWDVEYGLSGFLLGSGTLDNNLAVMSDNLTGLTASTDYHWYVRAVCDLNTTDGTDTVSYWVGPEMFTTAVSCPQPTSLNTTVNSPNDADLAWTAGLETEWVIEYGPAGFTPGTGTSSVTNTNPTNVTGLSPNMAYDFYVAAVCAPGDTSDWSGPNTFNTPISCFDVTGLNTTNVTATSADLNWTAGALETEWMVEWGMTGFMPGAGTLVNVTPAPTTSITGLSAGTNYDFYVQSVCGAGDSATWVGPFTFMSTITCPEPTNLSAINITNTAANLLWQAGGAETEWNLEWGTAGFMPNTGSELGNVNTNATPYYATGLGSCGIYSYYVQGVCGVGDSSSWAGPFTFSTLQGTAIAPYSETFDAGLTTPNCWTNTGAEGWSFNASGAGGPGWGVSGSVDHTSGTGNFAWIDASGGIGTNEFTSPMINYSSLANAYVGYWILSNNVEVGGDANVQNVMTLEGWDGTNWIQIGQYSANDVDWVKVEYVVPSSLPTTTQFRLIQSEGPNGGNAYVNDLLVDDFYVVDGPPCTPMVSAGTAVTGPVCTNGATDMFDAITGYTDGDGTWYFPNATDVNAQAFAASNGSLVLTGLTAGVDYTFDYVVANACGSDTVSAIYNWSPAVNAGGDGSVTTCVNHDVVLIQELTGSVDFGGTWSDDDNATGLVNGILYPALVVPGTYNFSYVIDNGTCSDTAVVAVTVDACLSVEENANTALEVYPNPVQDVLTIANLNIEGSAVITLVDVQGKIVYTKNITDLTGNFQLDLTDFENGVYIIEVTSDSNTQKVRVVKH